VAPRFRPFGSIWAPQISGHAESRQSRIQAVW
jgi:hypothetical protein